jgi:hypothetical protein
VRKQHWGEKAALSSGVSKTALNIGMRNLSEAAFEATTTQMPRNLVFRLYVVEKQEITVNDLLGDHISAHRSYPYFVSRDSIC